MARWGVNVAFSTAYHPETDGQTERYQRVLAESLRAVLDNTGDYAWPDVLPFVVYSLNSTVQESLGMSAYEADYAREPMQWLDGVAPGRSSATHGMSDKDLRAVTDRMVQNALEEAQARMKQYADAKRRPSPRYKVGDRVYASSRALRSREENEMLGSANKLKSKRVGPFRIKRQINSRAYELELPPLMKRVHPVVNVSYLHKADDLGSFGRADEPTPVMVTGDGSYYQPKSVLKWRHHKKKGHEYLVSWVGYGTEEDSWLSVKDLELCPGMVRAFWEAQGERPPKGALP